jgi:integrase/recombinase XerD
MATLMLEGGADIRFIQAMLGHTDLQATSIYTQVAITKLKEVHTASTPGRGCESRATAPSAPSRRRTRTTSRRSSSGTWAEAEADEEDQDLDPE